MMNVGFKNKKIDESYNHSGFNKIINDDNG